MGIVTSTMRGINAWAHLPSTLRAGYVLGWGALFGANIWNSFIGGVIAFKTLPRQIFGNLQARQFPIFFLYSTLASLSLLTLDLKLRSPLLLTHFKSHPFTTISTILTTSGFWTSTAGLGVVTAGLHAVNGIWVTPAATRVMFDRHRLERIEGRGKESLVPRSGDETPPSTEMQSLNTQFTYLHSLSSSLNTIALFTTGMIGWKIGQGGLMGMGMSGSAGPVGRG